MKTTTHTTSSTDRRNTTKSGDYPRQARVRFTRGHSTKQHRLPVCSITRLARFRDRHQARQAAQAHNAGTHRTHASVYACPDCRGYHLDHAPVVTTAPTTLPPAPAGTVRRRYVLVDIENLTNGAQATRTELLDLWQRLVDHLNLTEADHVVIGAAKSVAWKYRGLLHATNIKWVIGANAPDAADHALLAAIDLHQVTRRFNEVVICSGDHAFTNLAHQTRSHAPTVHVVTTPDLNGGTTLAATLRQAATTHTQLTQAA